MKKLLILTLLFTGISVYGQVPRDYYTQGYNTGCKLGKEANEKSYIATVGQANFPLEYRNGVREGYYACYKPIKIKGGGISDFIKCNFFNDKKACKKINRASGKDEE